MTSHDIENALLHKTWVQNVTLPRYTPVGWWECDVMEITKARLFIEYEIKTSRSDFLADSKKVRTSVFGVFENKHALLAKRDLRGPSRFWYVTPKGLLKKSELPEWAGLIEVEEVRAKSWLGMSIFTPHIEHRAPLLHRNKLDATHLEAMYKTCYYRFHHARIQIARLKQRAEKFSSKFPGQNS